MRNTLNFTVKLDATKEAFETLASENPTDVRYKYIHDTLLPTEETKDNPLVFADNDVVVSYIIDRSLVSKGGKVDFDAIIRTIRERVMFVAKEADIEREYGKDEKRAIFLEQFNIGRGKLRRPTTVAKMDKRAFRFLQNYRKYAATSAFVYVNDRGKLTKKQVNQPINNLEKEDSSFRTLFTTQSQSATTMLAVKCSFGKTYWAIFFIGDFASKRTPMKVQRTLEVFANPQAVPTKEKYEGVAPSLTYLIDEDDGRNSLNQ